MTDDLLEQGDSELLKLVPPPKNFRNKRFAFSLDRQEEPDQRKLGKGLAKIGGATLAVLLMLELC
jgi:hypothetical protein